MSKRPPVSKPANTKDKRVTKATRISREVAKNVTGRANGLVATFETTLPVAKNKIADGLQALVTVVALKDLTPPQMAETHSYCKTLEDAVEEATKIIRARVLEATLAMGNDVGAGKGSKELDIGGGYVQRVTVAKSGVDPKKLEAGIRAKGRDVTRYMATVITFKATDEGVQRAIDDGVFTPAELEAMAYEPSYRVERLKQKTSDTDGTALLLHVGGAQ